MTKILYKIVICITCLAVFSSTIHADTHKLVAEGEKNRTSVKSSSNVTNVKSILTEMDKRMNKDSLLKVGMEVHEDNKVTEYDCTMKAKNNNQYLLLRYYSPDRWKDTSILMIKENIWIYDHHSDRFLEVPRNLAFGGTDIAHGDMMRLNISNNYDGKITAEDEDTWTVNLTTTNRTMPYSSIEMSINKEGYYPITAKCFSKSEKLIKQIEYSEVREINGIKKPMKLTFSSPYELNKFTIVKYYDEKLIEYPDYIFNKWVLKSGLDEQF